jgi:hypothetical protein
MTTRIGDWMETYTGVSFYSFDPHPDEINLRDIAHSLSLICRFNGHAKHLYTVAQHSLNVQRLLKSWGASPRVQLKGLLHDASEAYLCDIPRPLKPYVQGYYEAEARVQDMIYAKYGVLNVDDGGMVKLADEQMLGYEANRLMPCVNWSPDNPNITADVYIDISELVPADVELDFLVVAEIARETSA